MICSKDIAFVAQRRVLRKSPEQKALIRDHLQKFCPLYQNMADRQEDYVGMFPIHSAYIDTFQHMTGGVLIFFTIFEFCHRAVIM